MSGAVSGVFLAVAVSSWWLSGLFFRWASAHGILDDPQSNPARKRQRRPVPLLGGSGAVLAAVLGCFGLWLNRETLALGSLLDLNQGTPNLEWLAVSILLLGLGGYFDDKYDLSAKVMIIPITAALLIAVFPGNLVIDALSYPFNAFLPDWYLLPELLGFLWLGLCLASTKFLDGHDGLVAVVGLISFVTIGSVALFPIVFQPLVFGFAGCAAAALLGFLPHNFPHARGYLGEGASELIGFGIGVLSIISGAKIATTATVLGWFILDMILVFFTRFLLQRPLFEGDRLHWHFRLVDLGLSKLQVLILTTFALLVTAHLGLSLPTSQKPFLLATQGLFLTTVFFLTLTMSLSKKIKTP